MLSLFTIYIVFDIGQIVNSISNALMALTAVLTVGGAWFYRQPRYEIISVKFHRKLDPTQGFMPIIGVQVLVKNTGVRTAHVRDEDTYLFDKNSAKLKLTWTNGKYTDTTHIIQPGETLEVFYQIFGKVTQLVGLQSDHCEYTDDYNLLKDLLQLLQPDPNQPVQFKKLHYQFGNRSFRITDKIVIKHIEHKFQSQADHHREQLREYEDS